MKNKAAAILEDEDDAAVGAGPRAARRAQLTAEEEARRELEESKLTYKNKDGKMLMYELEVHGREGAPDPLNYIINEETFVIRRRHKVVVPWYVVAHINLNSEVKYTPQKDESGRLRMVPQEQLAEPFTARPISPAGEVPV
jgi:hypothetical protein